MNKAPWSGNLETEGRFPRGSRDFGADSYKTVVFDKGRSNPPHANNDAGHSFNFSVFGVFQNRSDLAPARAVVTGHLMGDPQPGRPMPTDEPAVARRRDPETGNPIYLTFKDLRRGMEEA